VHGFLRQSIRTNYCGVYAVGMLLSLSGVPTTRRLARRLFRLHRLSEAYRGTSLREMSAVLSMCFRSADLRWTHHRNCSYPSVAHEIDRATCGGASPTVAVFDAVRGRMRVRHAVVVLSANVRGISVLDPLGRRPSRAGAPNCALIPLKTRAGLYPMDHRVYSVDLTGRTSILRFVRYP
jgi:hypothetical protein